MKLKKQLEKQRKEEIMRLTKRRNQINEQRAKTYSSMKESRDEVLNRKKFNYKLAMNDKYLRRSILQQFNTSVANRNNCKHAKIRQEFNEMETRKMKRQFIKDNQRKHKYDKEMNFLKKNNINSHQAYSKLEVMEKKWIDKLNKTKTVSLRFIENLLKNKSKGSFKTIKNINKSVDYSTGDDLRLKYEIDSKHREELGMNKSCYYRNKKKNNKDEKKGVVINPITNNEYTDNYNHYFNYFYNLYNNPSSPKDKTSHRSSLKEGSSKCGITPVFNLNNGGNFKTNFSVSNKNYEKNNYYLKKKNNNLHEFNGINYNNDVDSEKKNIKHFVIKSGLNNETSYKNWSNNITNGNNSGKKPYNHYNLPSKSRQKYKQNLIENSLKYKTGN